jgi:hypothetical protein
MGHPVRDGLLLKRAALSRGTTTSLTCSPNGAVVGRIMKVTAVPEDGPWV